MKQKKKKKKKKKKSQSFVSQRVEKDESCSGPTRKGIDRVDKLKTHNTMQLMLGEMAVVGSKAVPQLVVTIRCLCVAVQEFHCVVIPSMVAW